MRTRPRWRGNRHPTRPQAAVSRAIADIGVPDADAMMIIARRTRIDLCLPSRTICCSRRPSSSLSRRARTGSAITSPGTRFRHHKIECEPAPTTPPQPLRCDTGPGEPFWSAHYATNEPVPEPSAQVRNAPDRRLGALARRFNLYRGRAPIMRFCARGAGWPKTFTAAGSTGGVDALWSRRCCIAGSARI